MYQQRINYLEKNLPRINPTLASRSHVGEFDSVAVESGS